MKICVLIPAYNEAEMIGPLVQALKKRPFDVLVVDDGSTDETLALAKKAGAGVISHERKCGKGHSLRDGFSYILQRDYDGVLIMDGDGQHDPGDIDHFLRKAQDNSPCIVNGNRLNDHQGMPWLRLTTNRLMSSLISRMCNDQIADTQCGYRFISLEILRKIHLSSSDFEIETEILIEASRNGYKIFSVPVKTIYRREVSYIHPFGDTVRFLRYILKVMLAPSDRKKKKFTGFTPKS